MGLPAPRPDRYNQRLRNPTVVGDRASPLSRAARHDEFHELGAEKLRDLFWDDPLMALAIAAALVAFATTPLAFAVLGRLEWFKARRGRTMQRPDVRVDRRRR